MRNFIFMVVLMLGVSIISTAQSVTFKAEMGEFTETTNWNDGKLIELGQNIFVTWNMDDEWIQVVGTETVKYYIVIKDSILDEETYANKLSLIFECVTAGGTKRTIALSWFDDETISFNGLYTYRWRLAFDDFGVGYYCNIVE